MKNLETIALEYAKIVKAENYQIFKAPKSNIWDFYQSISTVVDGKVHCIYFQRQKEGTAGSIEMSMSQGLPDHIVKIIKGIEPLAVIGYYEIQKNYIRKTI